MHAAQGECTRRAVPPGLRSSRAGCLLIAAQRVDIIGALHCPFDLIACPAPQASASAATQAYSNPWPRCAASFSSSAVSSQPQRGDGGERPSTSGSSSARGAAQSGGQNGEEHEKTEEEVEAEVRARLPACVNMCLCFPQDTGCRNPLLPSQCQSDGARPGIGCSRFG